MVRKQSENDLHLQMQIEAATYENQTLKQELQMTREYDLTKHSESQQQDTLQSANIQSLQFSLESLSAELSLAKDILQYKDTEISLLTAKLEAVIEALNLTEDGYGGYTL